MKPLQWLFTAALVIAILFASNHNAQQQSIRRKNLQIAKNWTPVYEKCFPSGEQVTALEKLHICQKYGNPRDWPYDKYGLIPIAVKLQDKVFFVTGSGTNLYFEVVVCP